ncbi:MAG: hypothetical protein GX079_00315 [Tissierellia bacterium]|nr:hypothetical protein [Tissierellia bacterium]
MDFIEFLDLLREKLVSSYDLYDEFELEGFAFDFYAKFFMRTERYIATKKAVIYGMETNDYFLVKRVDNLERADLEEYLDWAKTNIEVIVKPHDEHMASSLTLVLVVDQEPDQDLVKLVNKTKFHRGFSFGFKGWVDLRLVVYSLDEGLFISNKKGREVKDLFIQ